MGRPKKLNLEEVGVDPSDFETRNRIIQASILLFKEKGFKGGSMKDVAEAVSITPAALYYYFPGHYHFTYLPDQKQNYKDSVFSRNSFGPDLDTFLKGRKSVWAVTSEGGPGKDAINAVIASQKLTVASQPQKFTLPYSQLKITVYRLAPR